MITNDQYKTIKKLVETSLRVKASKFLGLAVPIASSNQFKEILQQRAKEYHDATHHCWAYRQLTDVRIDHAFSDAGEPSGTAGKPILSAIEGRDLVNIGVIVTRYFGGTKLGTGGLARAYTDCANQTLDSSDVITKTMTAQITIVFPYNSVDPVMKTIDRFQGVIIDSKYGMNAEISVSIPRSKMLHFKEELLNICRGNIQFSN